MDWGGGDLPFRFNFAVAAAGECEDPEKELINQAPAAPAAAPPPAEEVFQDEEVTSKTYVTETVSLQRGLTLLKGRVSAAAALGVSNTDLVPGKYEGGFKLWECTIDLIETLRREIQDGRLTFRGKRVLELGCGHGLPGILACLKGASAVHFQDFNAAVLKSLTIPNVNVNTLETSPARTPRLSDAHLSSRSKELKELSPELRFFAGDWSDVHHLLSVVHPSKGSEFTDDGNSAEFKFSFGDGDVLLNRSTSGDDIASTPANGAQPPTEGVRSRLRSRSGSRACDRAVDTSEGEGGYDIILMSETVYSLPSLPKLYALIKKCLRPSYGVVYMAAKKHYFGVGGGSRQFKSVVEEEGIMGAHLVAEFADGSSNVREIWKFFFR